MAKNTARPKMTPKIEPVEPVEIEQEEVAEVQPEPPKPVIGIVMNCNRLNVRAAALMTSTIVTVITEGTEVLINESASTNEFYKVWTAAGFEGFCLKKFIEIKQ